MPFVLIPGALRSIRKRQRLDRKDAARLVKMDERTLHRHESDELAPRTLQRVTVKCYCDGYKVEPKSLVKWIDHEEDATTRKERSDRIRDPAAPKIATLTQRAMLERELGVLMVIDKRAFLDFSPSAPMSSDKLALVAAAV